MFGVTAPAFSSALKNLDAKRGVGRERGYMVLCGWLHNVRIQNLYEAMKLNIIPIQVNKLHPWWKPHIFPTASTPGSSKEKCYKAWKVYS